MSSAKCRPFCSKPQWHGHALLSCYVADDICPPGIIVEGCINHGVKNSSFSGSGKRAVTEQMMKRRAFFFNKNINNLTEYLSIDDKFGTTWWQLWISSLSENYRRAIHYSDVIMIAIASQIIGVSIVCSAVCSGEDQRKHQSSASLGFVRENHRWPVNSPHRVTQKMFPFDDVIMTRSIPNRSCLWSSYSHLANFQFSHFKILET